jgi:hypothetical protein
MRWEESIMATAERPALAPAEQQLTPEEVHETYEQLGLNDPEIRRRLLELAAIAEERPRIGSWLHADTDTASVR